MDPIFIYYYHFCDNLLKYIILTYLLTLARPETTFLHLATDTKKLIKQYGPDLSVLDSLLNMTTKLDRSRLGEQFLVKSDYEYRSTDRVDELPRHVAYGAGETDSCYLLQSFLYNDTDWNNSEVYRLYKYYYIINIIDI